MLLQNYGLLLLLSEIKKKNKIVLISGNIHDNTSPCKLAMFISNAEMFIIFNCFANKN